MDLQLNDAVNRMILSASGWRTIFAIDGNEESSSPHISPAHKIIAAAAAKVFSDFLDTNANFTGAVIVGRDTRPTGEAIAEAIISSLIASGREVRYVGIAAAPEIMALARLAGGNSLFGDLSQEASSGANFIAAGFVYISASHNPIGHNGIKFGLCDGGVLQAGDVAQLVTAFKSFMADAGRIEKAKILLEENEKISSLAQVYAEQDINKKAALTAYREFTNEVISGCKEKSKSEEFFDTLREGLKKQALGIAADFNGSARTVSIDRDFFQRVRARLPPPCRIDGDFRIGAQGRPDGAS